MALTQSDLDNLDRAIATGVTQAMVDGRMVAYRSTDELMKARAHVARMLAGSARRPRAGFARATFADSADD